MSYVLTYMHACPQHVVLANAFAENRDEMWSAPTCEPPSVLPRTQDMNHPQTLCDDDVFCWELA